ncbi:MAG: cytochrome b [Gallionellaceae bacterium]
MSTIITRYSKTAVMLHWLMALLIFVAFPLGMYMHGLRLSPIKLQLYSYHKWLGVTVFAFAILRLAWRATHTPPALPAVLPHWQKVASQTTHYLLYVLIFVVPLSGWLMSSAKGFKTVWFGVLPLPDLLAKNKALGHLLTTVHESLNYILLALVVMHVAAALKHHFIDKDDVLKRMSPIGKRS